VPAGNHLTTIWTLICINGTSVRGPFWVLAVPQSLLKGGEVTFFSRCGLAAFFDSSADALWLAPINDLRTTAPPN
jgi:hypothetical protein